jgi:hypothetical protein
LARPDLSYLPEKIAIEYEGDHHRTDRQQWKRDKSRRRLLEDHGWLVIEVIDDDVAAEWRRAWARYQEPPPPPPPPPPLKPPPPPKPLEPDAEGVDTSALFDVVSNEFMLLPRAR